MSDEFDGMWTFLIGSKERQARIRESMRKNHEYYASMTEEKKQSLMAQSTREPFFKSFAIALKQIFFIMVDDVRDMVRNLRAKT